jgi:hypothetical protein
LAGSLEESERLIDTLCKTLMIADKPRTYRRLARKQYLKLGAYNEGSDLKKQVEDYHRLNGYYPKVVITDKIYGNRENRQWLKELGIR